MEKDCLFCQIISGEKPGGKVYEDSQVFAFADINPQAPTHILIIPKKHIPTLREVTKEDKEIIGQMIIAAQQIARQNGVEETGYRLVFNVGKHSGQIVDHLHLHLLGGKPLGPIA